jgi:anti-sigma regulatory factor (Ser/Thr protein kinase)
MAKTHYRSFRADDRSFFSLIKKDIHQIVLSAGFDEGRAGKVDIIVSELTSNLSKYADGGRVLAGMSSNINGEYFEVISLDDGPGIADLNRVLSDGYSSTGSLGHGLGSIRRLSDQSDLYSLKDWGTIVTARIYKNEPGNRKKGLDCQGLNVPKPGEQVSGDGFCIRETPAGFRLLMADGLGHGPEAHAAVEKACEAFSGCSETSPTDSIRFIHDRIRKTRGVVGLVVFFDKAAGKWSIAGVGNIAARWTGYNNSRTYVSYNGIIGFTIPGTMNDQVLSQEEFNQFIACSDGIKSRWDLAKFPGIGHHDGMIIASAIYKEFVRGNDDTSVIVCKSV